MRPTGRYERSASPSRLSAKPDPGGFGPLSARTAFKASEAIPLIDYLTHRPTTVSRAQRVAITDVRIFINARGPHAFGAECQRKSSRRRRKKEW